MSPRNPCVGLARAWSNLRHQLVHHHTQEDTVLFPVVVQHQEAPEFQAALRQLRRQSPVTAGWFFAWLQDGADPDAQAWLDAEIPGPIRSSSAGSSDAAATAAPPRSGADPPPDRDRPARRTAM